MRVYILFEGGVDWQETVGVYSSDLEPRLAIENRNLYNRERNPQEGYAPGMWMEEFELDDGKPSL